MKPHGYAVNAGFALGYTAIYAWCYSAFVAYHFAYAGADLFRRDGLFLVTSFVIAVLPILCYRGVRAISSVFSVLVYLLLYVPIVITFAYASSKPLDEIVVVQLTFMLGMVLLFMADAVIVRSPVNLDAGIDLMPIVLTLTLVLTAYTFIVYRGHLHFAGFDEAMYDQRFANVELGSGFATRYLLSWLATVLVPLCLAHGLAAKDYRYVAGGTLASLLLYMGAANKITILLPFVFPIFYFGIGKRIRSFYPLTTGGLSLAIAALMAVSALPGTILFVASSILINRTITNGGQLAVKYYDFFSFYPQTNYAHVNGLKLLLPPYPYGDLIPGQVVGQFFWSASANTNASFWVTDGIAAMGLLGVVAASMGCALLFVVMNTITHRHNILFVATCFLPFLVTLLNQSMFSSLLSGGGLLLLAFFLVNSRSSVHVRA